MSNQLIPLTPSPNQTFGTALNVDNAIVQLYLRFVYNEIAQYWMMAVYDVNGNLLLDSVPLITGADINGNDLSMNILNQFAYLGIGSAVMANASGITSPDYPNSLNLGTDYVLVWGDTP